MYFKKIDNALNLVDIERGNTLSIKYSVEL